VQSERSDQHAAALARLAEGGWLYPCRCTRSEIKRAALPAADGGFRYPGTCRDRSFPDAGWRACAETIRLRLPPGRVAPVDEGGLDLTQDPLREMGDPVLRRRDGAFAYHLAAVVDDAAQKIDRVVRGRDLATSTAIHLVLQRALGFPTPSYRHHFLLLEEHGGKLAKLHGAVGWGELREHGPAKAWCGLLARVAGLAPDARPVAPRDLVDAFDWSHVRRDDVVLKWTGEALVVGASVRAATTPARS